jgi:hypothetical protein
MGQIGHLLNPPPPPKICVEIKFEEKKEIRRILIPKIEIIFLKICSCILNTLGLLVTSVLNALNGSLSAFLLPLDNILAILTFMRYFMTTSISRGVIEN